MINNMINIAHFADMPYFIFVVESEVMLVTILMSLLLLGFKL